MFVCLFQKRVGGGGFAPEKENFQIRPNRKARENGERKGEMLVTSILPFSYNVFYSVSKFESWSFSWNVFYIVFYIVPKFEPWS